MKIGYCDLAACNALLFLRRERQVSWRAFGLGMVIASFAEKDTGEAWPSRATLSAITGVKETDISAVVRELRDAGFLTIEEREGRSNIYRLTHPHLATGSNSVPIPEQRPTHPLLALKPIPEQRPITIKEQLSNKYIAHDDEKQPSSEAETLPATDTKNPEVEPPSPASKTKAKTKAKTTKVTPKNRHPAGDLDADAEKLVNLYAELVKPKRDDASGSRKVFLGTAKRLLAEGKSSSDMVRAVQNYAASRVRLENQEKDPEAARKYRIGFQTFFGPKNEHWRDYVAMEVPNGKEAASGSQGNLENLADRVNAVAAKYGDKIGRRYDAKARELKSTAAADQWLAAELRREGVA